MVSRSRDYVQERNENFNKPPLTFVTIKDLEKLNASCNDCKLQMGMRCTLKHNKKIQPYNICTQWKTREVKE